MPLQSSAGSNQSVNEIRVFKYRWVIVTIFVLVSVVNFMQLLQFSIIADTITKYISQIQLEIQFQESVVVDFTMYPDT